MLKFPMVCYASYTCSFKLQVVKYAIKHGNRTVERSVDEVCTRYWRLQHAKLQATKNMLCLSRTKKWKVWSCWGGSSRACSESVESHTSCYKIKHATRSHSTLSQEFKPSNSLTTHYMQQSGLHLRKYIHSASYENSSRTFSYLFRFTILEEKNLHPFFHHECRWNTSQLQRAKKYYNGSGDWCTECACQNKRHRDAVSDGVWLELPMLLLQKDVPQGQVPKWHPCPRSAKR